MLTLVSTPIGNLQDITLRALEQLKNCDSIICEDTRRTSLLLQNFQIKKPLLILNDYQEPIQVPKFIELLQQGKNLCLVSDAGSPLISDPGFKLVRTCIDQGIQVDSIPGPTALILALQLSGLPPDKFTFLGYLPEKPGARSKVLTNLIQLNQIIKTTFIIYIAPHKLIKTITEIKEVLGDIELVLAKELTKINQKILKKSCQQWLEELNHQKPKGEYILLLHLSS